MRASRSEFSPDGQRRQAGLTPWPSIAAVRAKRLRLESDEALMVRAKKDELPAFGELYDRHAGNALRVARSVCSDAGVAEDAVQEGFLSLWQGRARYRPEAGSFKAWAMTAVRNRAIDLIRAAAARPKLAESQDDQPDQVSTSPPEQVISREEAVALRASLEQLPEEQSEVIALAFFGELTHAEISRQLELPLGTVKGRLRLGLEKLRAELGPQGRSDPRSTDQTPLELGDGATSTTKGSQNDGAKIGAAVRREERRRDDHETVSP